jgi:hypothetical protein
VVQQTCCFGFSVAQKVDPELILVNSAPVMPHFVASDAQLSPDSTCTVLHVARAWRALARMVELAVGHAVVPFVSRGGVTKLA